MEKLSKKVEQAIEEAIKLEISGRKFFLHAAEVTHSELGKKMFEKLAEEEVSHLHTFGKLFSEIIQDSDWKKYVMKEEVEGTSELIEELASKTKGAEGKGDMEAITIGMELEMKAIQFFQKSAHETDDPVAAKIFIEVCEEEKFHYDMLQSQYDALTHDGNWLDSAEFRMDGKW
jgi:rubrerythrin